MPYTAHELPEYRYYTGSVFADAIECEKPVHVNGDLICDYITCPTLVVKEGSLICPQIEVESVCTDILGFYDLDAGPFDAPPGWTYTWLRPLLDDALPDPERWAAIDSIRNVVKILEDPRIVGQSVEAHRFLQRLQARPTCARAQVLFAAALEVLWEDAARLTPLGKQVIGAFIAQPSLPHCWRY
jgi:hypothetical protein